MTQLTTLQKWTAGLGVAMAAVLLAPLLLSDTLCVSRDRIIKQPLPFLYHACSDTMDVNLWFRKQELMVMPAIDSLPNLQDTTEKNSKTEDIFWHRLESEPLNKIILWGTSNNTDSIELTITLEQQDTDVRVELTTRSTTGYFERLWKWVLSWRESSQLADDLTNLTALVQERAVQRLYYRCVVSETGMGERHFSGYRNILKDSDIPRFFSLNAQQLYSLANTARIASPGRACLLRYANANDKDSADIYVGLPVPSYLQLSGTQANVLPAGTYAAVVVKGDEKNITLGRKAVITYLADRNLVVKYPLVEEYIHETAVDADPHQWVTKIYAAYK